MISKKAIYLHILFYILFLKVYAQPSPDCALIITNLSAQIPDDVCAPVNLTMEVEYGFSYVVDPTEVEILFVWNDGLGSETRVPAVSSHGNTLFSATETHFYPPGNTCSYTAEAYLVAKNEICVSSSRQEQTFSAWAMDNENGAYLRADPVEHRICEGEGVVDFTFEDESFFNCNLSVEPDRPNQRSRWVQFIYNTNVNSADRIPNVTVTDGSGNVFNLTDGSGNSLGAVSGPIEIIPFPANGSNQTSWRINAPPGGVEDDIFEITMRNWNVCNPYDRNPFDGNPPSDIVNGEEDPIVTTSIIKVIRTPGAINPPKQEFCTGDNLTVTISGSSVRWYTDAALTDRFHTGSTFNLSSSPINLDNSVPGLYTFYVTNNLGKCESSASPLVVEVFESPTTANAGPDQYLCANNTTLAANNPSVGSGVWTTSSGANIMNTADNTTAVNNLDVGANRFYWTITNGPCQSDDEVIVYYDIQPSPANAGSDISVCESTTAMLNAVAPDFNGKGSWSISTGFAFFADLDDPGTGISGLQEGLNTFIWTVESEHGGCPVTTDSVLVIHDVQPDPALVSADKEVCETNALIVNGNTPTDNGSGQWKVLTSGPFITDTTNPAGTCSNLVYGDNLFEWIISSEFGICPKTSDTITVTRYQMPAPAFAGVDQELCDSLQSNPLGANIPSVGQGTWSVITTLTNVSSFIPTIHDENAIFEISAGDEGEIDLQWTIENGTCVTIDTVTIDFGIKPVIPASAKDTVVCGIQTILQGNDPVKGKGIWTQISGPGTINFVSGRDTSYSHVKVGLGEEGTYLVEWSVTSGSCPVDDSNRDTAVVIFKPQPMNPFTFDFENCGPDYLNLSLGLPYNSTTLRWYETSASDSILIQNRVFTTPVLYNSRSYYVSAYNDTANCESERTKMDVWIHAVPDEPYVNDVQHCGPDTIRIEAFVGANGKYNRWYDRETGGKLLAGTEHFTTDRLYNSETYWVSSYNDSTGCEGNRAKVGVIIDSVPKTPVVSDVERCGPGGFTLNVALAEFANKNRWWTNETANNLLATSVNYVTDFLDSTAYYWVSAFNDTTFCESERVQLEAVIHPIPGLPTVDTGKNCGPGQITIPGTPGQFATTNRWYGMPGGTNVLATSNNFDTPLINHSTPYWVSSYNDSTFCESQRVRTDAIILDIPQTTPIQGIDRLEEGKQSVIYSVDHHAGSTYAWSIQSGVDKTFELENFVILGFPTLGTYTISVQETAANGCPGEPREKEITVTEFVVVLDLNTHDTSMCLSDKMQFLVDVDGGTPLYDFIWTGDTEYLSATNTADPVFDPGAPGIYRLYIYVEDANGFGNQDSIEIEVFANPTVSFNKDTLLVCAGNDLPVSANILGGSRPYKLEYWTGNTLGLNATLGRNQIFNSSIRGNYKMYLNVLDNNLCTAADSILVQNVLPESSFISEKEPKCSPAIFAFENRSKRAVSYTWDFGDGTQSIKEDPEHLFLNKTTTLAYVDVTLAATDTNGCTDYSKQIVVVYPNPDQTFSVTPAESCDPVTAVLISSPGGEKYFWDFGDGTQKGAGYTVQHTFENHIGITDTFDISLISTSFFGCTDTFYNHIIVHPSPKPAFTVEPLSQMFPDTTVRFTYIHLNDDYAYSWDFGDGKTSKAQDPLQHSYLYPGNYEIQLKMVGEKCTDSLSRKITIIPHPPEAKFKSVEPGCMPHTINFENQSQYADEYIWEFGDGSVSQKPNPTYTYYEPGTYKIKLTARTHTGLVDEVSDVSEVYVLPNAFFDMAPKIVFVNDEPVHFFDLSDNADIYEWDFGDSTISTEATPMHVYQDPGIYSVTLKVWTNDGCFDLYVKENAVIVEEAGEVVFPNAIKPYSLIEDNRTFKPAIIDEVETYHLMIFNRWGELIFESFNQDIGWDAYYQGKPVKQDVYVWKLKGKYVTGKLIDEMGDVTVIY